MTSEDGLAQRRQCEFAGKLCRSVLHVEDRIDFDEIQRQQFPGVGDHLHQHVGFPVAEAALNRRADAWPYLVVGLLVRLMTFTITYQTMAVTVTVETNQTSNQVMPLILHLALGASNAMGL